MFKKPRRANSALVAAQEAIDGVASRRVDRDLPNPMHNGIDRASESYFVLVPIS